MTQPEAVLFDLDGTLIDTAPDFIRCLNLQRQRHNLAPLPDERIREVVSNGARALVSLGFDLGPEDPDYRERHSELIELYRDNLAVETRLFPGMDEVLSRLEARAIPWGIVTNKPRALTVPLLEGLNLAQRCGSVVCPDDVSQRKPDPESLYLACKQVGAPAVRSVYVGDHLRDIEAGRAAGMITFAARWGYIASDEDIASWRADYIVDRAVELLEHF